MKKPNTRLFTLLLSAAAASLLLTAAQGAAYIKFDGVDGEAKDKDHRGWSDLLSFSQAMHQPGGGATGATRRRGDVILEDITVTKELDKSSPKIAEAVCKGKVYPKIEIELTRDTEAGRVTYYRYELKNVLVTSYSVGTSASSGGEAVPMESFSLNFEEIKVTYTENDYKGKKKGNVEYSWKVEEGEAAVVEPDPIELAPVRFEALNALGD